MLLFSKFRTRLLVKKLRSFRNYRHASLAIGIQQSQERTRSPWLLYSAAALSVLGYCNYKNEHRAQACGIVGYVGDGTAVDFLVEGLRILQNRGYDSAGICSVRSGGTANSELITTKYASKGSTSDCILLLEEEAPAQHGTDSCGIAHTRWATHGAKTDENSHPHSDYKNRVALVHNGTIENCAELKKELQEYGIVFKSQTDTEVIVQMIGYYLDQGCELMDALEKALARMEGSWGIALVSKDHPNQIVATCNGSPLIVGVDEGSGRMFVASEHTAFSRYTSEVIPLRNNEIAVLNSSGVNLNKSRILQAPKEDIQLSPDPYPHWTIKEIHDQPEAISRALGYGSRLNRDLTVRLGGLMQEEETLREIKNLVISACGTSLYASEYGALLMRYLKSFDTVQVVDAAECAYDAFPLHAGGLCVLSQSGETKDVIRVLDRAEQLGLPAFSCVNQVGSFIARKTGLGVYLYAGREHAVASTKAFTNQVVCLALVAGYFMQLRDGTLKKKQRNLVDALMRMSPYANMCLRSQDQCKEIAQKIKDKQTLFVLGKGFAYPIAKEGALKIKEIAYIHAEGYSGGALKHGPFALIEEGTPVILIIPDDEHAKHMIIAAHEVSSRGAHVIVITDNPDLCQHLHDIDVIPIPSNDVLTSLLAVIPLQLLAYELSIARGIDPDKPRNLAKAVTVD